MPIIAMPDGTQVQFPDDMSRDQIRAMIKKKFPEADPQIGGKPYQFARGVVQGAIYDPVEGIGQLIEHASGKKIPIPPAVRNWFDKVRERTEATTAGTAGRWTGAIGSVALAPESAVARLGSLRMTQLAAPLGTAAKLQRRAEYARALGKKSVWDLTPAERASSDLGNMPAKATRAQRVARQAATGAAVGAAQPVEGDDENFATQKALQALTGGALGGVAGTPLGAIVGRHVARHPYHYGWMPFGAMMHPGTHLPAMGTLAALGAQYMAEKAGPRIAAPIGATTGRVFSGSRPEEAPDAEAD